MSSVILLRMIFSRVFATGDSSDIGRYELLSSSGLLGLSSGMILAVFQMPGIFC